MLSSDFLKVPRTGRIIGILIFLLILGTFFSLISYSKKVDILDYLSDPYLWNISLFTLKQSLLSTFISLVGAIPVALALHRRHFWGRSWLLKLCSMTFVLPSLVIVFGIVSIYGNTGLLQHLFPIKTFSIYGLPGILLAHVFFNLPLCVRLLTQSLTRIPLTQHQLAYHLGMNAWSKFKLIEWPIIKNQLFSIAPLVFMLCFTSFTIVMSLGGGPKATTIEVAIYQAIHYEFDLSAGAILGLWQILLTLIFTLVFQYMGKNTPQEAVSYVEKPLFISSPWLNFCDKLCLFIFVLFIIPPLLSVVVMGINTHIMQVLSDKVLWLATLHSVSIAFFSASFALLLGVAILFSSRIYRLKKQSHRAELLELSGMFILVTPSVVLSTGLFLLCNHFIYAFDYAFPLVILVNTLMALPYVLKNLSIPLLNVVENFEPLCLSLGMQGMSRWRLIEWRLVKEPFIYTFALALILSLGDLSAIALFGSEDFKTLPLYLYEQLGSYQMQGAAVTALLLFILSLGVFTLLEKTG